MGSGCTLSPRPVLDVVDEGVDGVPRRSLQLRVVVVQLRVVIVRVEVGAWIVTRRRALREVVQKRVVVGGGELLVGTEVIVRVEKRMRVKPLMPPDLEVVLESLVLEAEANPLRVR